jgi:Fur family ferric uptake transcriptional regulator
VLLEDGGHHHFLCSGCDRVIEIDECVIDDLLARLQGERRLQINSHLLELYGLCDSCQQLEQSQTSRRADYQLK